MNGMQLTRTLITGLALAIPAGAQAQRVTSVAEIVEELNAGVPTAQVLKHLRLECSSFQIDSEAEARIRLAGGTDDFIRDVREHCAKGIARLEVTSDPSGGTVKVDGRMVGATPYRGVVPVGGPATVEVQVGSQTRQAETTFPGGQVTKIDFTMARDTTNWSPPRTALAIARDIGVLNDFRPTNGRPPEPKRRGSGGAGRTLLFMLLGAGGGYAFGKFGPSGCVDLQTVSSDSYVDGEFTPAGTEVDLGGGTPCMGIAAGIGAGGGLLFSLPINAAVGGGRRRGYERAVAEYPATVAAWEESERLNYANNHPRVQQVMEQERLDVARIQETNRQILAGTAPSEPAITYAALEQADIMENRPRIEVVKDAGGPSDVDVNIPKGTVSNPTAIAVVIGNRDYQNNVPSVDFAIRDAETMKKYLIETLGFSADNIIFAANATVSKFYEIFGKDGDESGSRLANFVRSNTDSLNKPDVFVFYSGHGAPDIKTKRGFLVPTDANPLFISQNGYPADVLYKNLSKLQFRSLTVVLDACFSGGAERGSLVPAASPVFPNVDALTALPNAISISAAAGPEISSWFEEKRHGLFTYFFLKGIQGAADADANREITIREVGRYVQQNVTRHALREKNRDQHPQVLGRDIDRVLVTLPPQ